jgi:hypothetical protein
VFKDEGSHLTERNNGRVQAIRLQARRRWTEVRRQDDVLFLVWVNRWKVVIGLLGWWLVLGGGG